MVHLKKINGLSFKFGKRFNTPSVPFLSRKRKSMFIKTHAVIVPKGAILFKCSASRIESSWWSREAKRFAQPQEKKKKKTFTINSPELSILAKRTENGLFSQE